MGADVELGNMLVRYKADLSDLQSKMGQAKTSMSDADSTAQSTGANIFSAFSKAGTAILEFSEQAESSEEALTSFGAIGEEAGAEVGESMVSASSGFADFQEALSSLTASVGEAVSQIKEQLDSIPAEAEEDAEKSQSAFSGFDLGGMINQAGMTVFSLQAMGSMATQTASSLLGPAEQAENTQQSFSNLLGSSQAATNELGNLADAANKTQFKTQDYDNLASSMIAFKMPLDSVIPRITAVGDALTAVGRGTPAEMQGVVDVLGKMSIQGKLTQGDITQLGAHGIDATSAIAQGLGVSTDALQDMIKKGTLPANDAINALTTGIEGNPVYAGGMAKQAGTLSGQMSTLSSEWDQTMAAMMSPVLPELEQDFSDLGTMLTSPSFKAFAVTMGQDVATGIKDTVTGAKDLVSTGQNVISFFQHNQTAANALVAVLIGLGVGLLAFAVTQIPVMITALSAWAIAQWTVVAPVLATAAPFILIGLVVAGVVFGIIEAVQHWADITRWFQGLWTTVWGAVSSFFVGLWTDISSWFMGVLQAIGDFFVNLWTGVASFFVGVWNGIVGFFQGILHFIIDHAAQFGIGLFLVITGPIGFLALFIFSHWNQIWSFLVGVWGNIQGIFSGAESFFINLGMGMYHGFIRGVDLIIAGANTLIEGLDSISIHIPEVGVGPIHTPGFDWGGLGIPEIPLLATGGMIAPGGMAIVGDPTSGELVYGGASGASVYSHSQTAAILTMAVLAALQAQQQPQTIVVNVASPDLYVDGQAMTSALGQHITNAIHLEGGLRAR